MWTGHRPLWRGSKTGLTSSPVEAQSPCVREESPDFRHGEYVKKMDTLFGSRNTRKEKEKEKVKHINQESFDAT